MAANALELATGLFDLLLVRPFGPSATAAIGAGRQVTFLVEAVAAAITAGVISLVSRGVGARARSVPSVGPTDSGFGPDEVVGQSVSLVLLLGLPTALAGYW